MEQGLVYTKSMSGDHSLSVKSVLMMLSGHKLSYQVNIAELIEPEVVDGGGDGWKVIGLEARVTETNCSTQPRQNPPV